MSFDLQKIMGSRSTTAVLLALIAVFAIHLFATTTDNLRIDMTADNIYSLSDGTVAILERMNAEGVKPIEMKLYFSETAGKTLPRFIKDFITYQQYLEALLKQYESDSQGKIKVSFVDPEPDSDQAQDAADYGLDGKPINQHGDLFYFGLVFETQTGSRDKIEFLWPNQQETVEYEIAKRLSKLLWPRQERIGVLSSLEVLSDASDPYMAQVLAAQGKSPGQSWIAMQLLEESYEVTKIAKDTDQINPAEVDLLVVVHPKNLSERALWAIDEWVTRGGRTMIFLDPYAIDDQPPPSPQNQPWQQFQYKPSSNLEPLLAKWGLERPEDRVVADFNLGVRRQVSRLGPAELVIVDLGIDEDAKVAETMADHPVLQGLTNVRFFISGQLKTLDGVQEDGSDDGIVRTPLITTTGEGNTVEIKPGFPGDSDLVFVDLNEPAKINDNYTPGTEPVAMAYMVQGKLPALYPDGADIPEEAPAPPPGLPPGIELPPPTGGATIRKEAVPEEERGEATVMVFADVDFISDNIAFQQTPFGALAANDNHKILLNAVDFLFGSEELMRVRSKPTIRRPFTLFDEIEAAADRETLDRESELRADIARFEEELRDKQSSVASGNAALFQKELQDEVDELNKKITESNGELHEIRKAKRAALENEEARVRFAALGFMPTVVLILGLFLFFRRRKLDQQARSGQ